MSEPMTTEGLQAKVRLRQAWFTAHPNQPIPEGRAEVDALFAAIEAEARREAQAAGDRRYKLQLDKVDEALGPWTGDGVTVGRIATIRNLQAQAAGGQAPIDYDSTWREFEAFEDKAAKQGSGMTRGQMTGAAMMLGWLHSRGVQPAAAPRETADQLPSRIVVDRNGAYWRDFGEGYYSMAIVSTDNDPVEIVAVYVRGDVR